MMDGRLGFVGSNRNRSFPWCFLIVGSNRNQPQESRTSTANGVGSRGGSREADGDSYKHTLGKYPSSVYVDRLFLLLQRRSLNVI